MQFRFLAHSAMGAVTFGFMAFGCIVPSYGQALLGEPFGVAAVRVPLTGDLAGPLYLSGGLKLEERSGRVLYPVVTSGSLLDRIGENLLERETQVPREVEILFLFPGTEPLDLTVYTPAPQRLRLAPRREPPRIANRLFQRWWRGYHALARQQARIGDHSPLVYTYLTSMLAQRLGWEAPLLSRPEKEDSGFPPSLQLLFGVERLRDATLRRTIEGRTRVAEGPLEPLPAAPRWVEPSYPVLAAEPVIEPMAMHVPEECFYIRFGTFDNYLWVRNLTREFGGDLARMITLRGTNPQLDQRIQRQLALGDSILIDLFGGRVASDMALIGRDLFVREGPALGVIILARNSATLGTGLRQQRAEALAAEKDQGAELETLQIADRNVSFLSTPDNRLRSFYVADGDYHLVTTSQAIVERFLAAGQGERPLGASAEFRAARATMPVDRNDTIFAYFSSAFFRGLFSPEYQIELERRLHAVTDIELLLLAQLAARNEGLNGQTVDDWDRGRSAAARLWPPFRWQRSHSGTRAGHRFAARRPGQFPACSRRLFAWRDRGRNLSLSGAGPDIPGGLAATRSAVVRPETLGRRVEGAGADPSGRQHLSLGRREVRLDPLAIGTGYHAMGRARARPIGIDASVRARYRSGGPDSPAPSICGSGGFAGDRNGSTCRPAAVAAAVADDPRLSGRVAEARFLGPIARVACRTAGAGWFFPVAVGPLAVAGGRLLHSLLPQGGSRGHSAAAPNRGGRDAGADPGANARPVSIPIGSLDQLALSEPWRTGRIGQRPSAARSFQPTGRPPRRGTGHRQSPARYAVGGRIERGLPTGPTPRRTLDLAAPRCPRARRCPRIRPDSSRAAMVPGPGTGCQQAGGKTRSAR
jgi:hypothetical protein